MSKELSERDAEIWRRLSESKIAFALAERDFLAEGVDRVTLMRMALRGNVRRDNVRVAPGRNDRATALYIAQYMKTTELMQLFDELVYLASFAHGSIGAVRDLILSLPREWVLARIEAAAEPFLATGTYDEYRRFLELYVEFDRDLALKLARRVVAHPDPDIREAGEDTLEELGVRDDENV